MKKVLLLCMVMLLFVAGCSGSPQTGKTVAPAAQSASGSEKIDADAIYDKIETGMTLEQVQSLIGKEPVSKADSTADTPAGKVEIKNYSWQVGKTLITVVFENGKVTMKNKTSM